MVAAFAAYQSAVTTWRVVGTKKMVPRRIASLWERIVACKHVGPFALLIAIILGSLYRGLATPQEAASLGIIASLVLAASFIAN